MAKVTTKDEYGNTTGHDVAESASDATDNVNAALTNNQRFVLFTGQDEKQFTLVASTVAEIKDE
jgi:hypothetical protein